MRRSRWQTRTVIASLLGVTMLAPRGDTAQRARPAISAISPVEVVTSGGFASLAGIAVEAGGAVLVVDAARGTLTRIDASGRRTILAEHLQQPVGVAAAAGGDLFIIEAAGHRLVRLPQGGAVEAVTSGLKQPAALAAGPDGRIWVAARRPTGPDDLIARIDDSGVLMPVAEGIRGIRSLVADETVLYAATPAAVARVPLRPDGYAEAPQRMLSAPFKTVFGLGIDAAGSLFASGTVATNGVESGVIVKRQHTGEMTYLATGMTALGLAFAPNGDLLAIDRHDSRVLRFRAPGPPEVSVPEFTNTTQLHVAGRAGAGDLVQVFVNGDPRRPPIAAAAANRVTGGFSLAVPISEDGAASLGFAATGAAGAGLMGGVRLARVVYDGRLPDLSILEPVPGTHARHEVVVRAAAADEGSGAASIAIAVDDRVIVRVENGAGASAMTVTDLVDTRELPEGFHALGATAMDRAGNRRSVAQLLVVDRTPPDTSILGGPDPAGRAGAVIFVVDGVDALSPSLEFSWRLDDGPWSPYTTAKTMTVEGIASGTHRFEVRARDLAGNEDLSPDVQGFSAAPVGVRIIEPAPDATVAGETLWVRGTVTGREPVSVAVPVPVELRDLLPIETLGGTAISGTFAVEVPITPSLKVLAVTATDAQGNTATATVDVVAQAQEPAGGTVVLSPAAGFAPHTVRIGLQGLPPGSYGVDLEGDGVEEYSGEDADGREFVYARPGIYVAALRGIRNGQPYAWRAPVQVYDRADLEQQLQGTWDGFKQALRTGDVDRAVGFVHSSRRATWQQYFRQVPPSALAAADTVFTDITLLELSAGRIECEMMRDVGGLMYSYPVSFVPDADGQWRLWQF